MTSVFSWLMCSVHSALTGEPLVVVSVHSALTGEPLVVVHEYEGNTGKEVKQSVATLIGVPRFRQRLLSEEFH